jgi:hypothetical protein
MSEPNAAALLAHVACRHRGHARWVDEATAQHVASDMTENDEGVWAPSWCPGDLTPDLPAHGPHWHVIQEGDGDV